MMFSIFLKPSTLWSTVLAICLGIFGLAPPVRPADDLAAGAKKEGELNLYLSIDLSDGNGMMQAFRKKYPFSRCWLAWDKQNAVPTMADIEFCWTNLCEIFSRRR